MISGLVLKHSKGERLVMNRRYFTPCPPKKKFTKPRRKVEHHGTIPASRLPELYQFVMDGKSDATFKAAAVALIVSALRVANIAYLRQEHYDPKTGQFTIPEKTDDDDRLGLMKTGGQYSNTFPPEVRDMINAQMIEGMNMCLYHASTGAT